MLLAQNSFYHPDSIREVRIYFAESNWDHILDSLYVQGDKNRMLCAIEIDGIPYDSVGIRYKGFSSVSVDRKKNPFNIKLDYAKDHEHRGIDKLKLGNVIQDPSFLREVLSYEIARQYMPSSGANFANIYVNDTLWGLYTNIESVEKAFLSQHFLSNDEVFFKCSPEELDLNGENANLSNSPGTDTSDYYALYDMRSDNGWTELYGLIDVLNTDPTNVSSVLNVDRTLWMHAFNYALINFDSYVGYAQNYYLYQDNNGRFNPILWDLNMSFASFRLADASEFWDGFNIADAKTMDPLLHYNSVSVYPRPLMRKLFENDTYRRQYLAHMRTIIEENFANQNYAQRGQFLKDLIETHVLADTNKFYSDTDFQDNLNTTVSDLVDYPGITDLMDARTTYLMGYPGFQGSPDISNVASSPTQISIGDDVSITADIANGTSVTLAYRFGTYDLFTKVEMLDDGTQNDGAAGDGVYGYVINGVGNNTQYYIYSENDVAGRFSPARAAYEFYSVQAEVNNLDIVINEFMASNEVTIADNEGEYDDWIELYNTTGFDISLGGLFLSDDVNQLDKWPISDLNIPGGGFVSFWADNDLDQGSLHTNFKLSAGGEAIYLSNAIGMVLDSVVFGAQETDVSTGRYPNGTGPFMTMYPTFNTDNSLTSVNDVLEGSPFKIFPNPAMDIVHVTFEESFSGSIQIFDMNGQLVQEQILESSQLSMQVNTQRLPNGLYTISAQSGHHISSQKLIILK